MIIKRLTAENLKKISVVNIEPSGNLVEITGNNGQGKSSTLDAIWYALAGTSSIPASPIRRGQEQAKIVLDLGELVITRTFKSVADAPAGAKNYTTKISIEAADGSRFDKPQTVIDTLFDSLCFDPIAFARMKPADQFNELRKFVGGFDFEKIDALNRGDFSKRTDINREADQVKAAAAVISVPEGTPDEMVDEEALTAQLAEASRKNTEILSKSMNREKAAKEIEENYGRASTQRENAKRDANIRRAEAKQRYDEELARIDSDEKQGLAEADQLDERANNLKTRLAAAPPLEDPIDIDQLQSKLNQARVTNNNVRAKLDKKAKLARLAELQAQAAELTNKMDARTKQKQDAIAAVEMPVKGLGFGDGEVLFDGLPLEQASDAERVRISCAIAMSGNPKLRVCRIREGAFVDDAGMKIIAEMAADKGFQVWVETINPGSRPAIVIEDGHVKAAD